MGKTKLLFLLFVTIILTGCNVNYDLVINDKKEVKETVTVSSTNQKILESNDSINLYLDQQIDAYKQIDQFKRYSYLKNIGSTDSSITLSKIYPTLADYRFSPIFHQLFEDATIIQNQEYTSFKTVGIYDYGNVFQEKEQADPEFFISTINVRMKFYNEVLENNADVVDTKNNILEWHITAQDLQKIISFKISNKKRYDVMVMDFLINNKSNIIAISVVLLVVIIVGSYILIKLKRNNRI